MAHLWEYDQKNTQETLADIVAKFGLDIVITLLANVCYERADESRDVPTQKSFDFVASRLDDLSLRAKDRGLTCGTKPAKPKRRRSKNVNSK